MKDMNWAVWIPIIATQGINVAEKLWQLAQTGGSPTQADWDSLKALGGLTARDQLIASLNRAGIALDSPQAVALLALIPPTA